MRSRWNRFFAIAGVSLLVVSYQNFTPSQLSGQNSTLTSTASYQISASRSLQVVTSKAQCPSSRWNNYIMACDPSVTAMPLSTIVSASGGTAGTQDVEVAAGQIAYIDTSVDVGTLVINGELHCNNNSNAPIEIKAKTIYVNGLFRCGNVLEKFDKKIYFSLKDQDQSTLSAKQNLAYRAFLVNPKGKVSFMGRSQNAGVVRIAQTIQPGQTEFTVESQVNWQVGDTIVVASSTFDPAQSEIFLISAISQSSPYTITVNKAAAYQHWGSVETFESQNGEVTLDQRAEVVNLTRNIVIRADRASEISGADREDAQLGGHMMVHAGGFAEIDSVEFFKMGQAGLMGRYPFHWHVVGEASGQYIKNSSIHRSFQRCITIHETNGTLVDNNSCFDFRGHGYFLETGNEINNKIVRNIGIWAKAPTASKFLLASDNPKLGTPFRFPAVSVFWISHPNNEVTDNIAAGSVGTGFWMSFVPGGVKKRNPVTGALQTVATPISANTLKFDRNIAHSTLVGHTWDGATKNAFTFEPPSQSSVGVVDSGTYVNPNNSMDQLLDSANYNPSVIPVFSGLVAYKNTQAGIYFRGSSAIFQNSVLADNGWSLFLAYNQIIKNSIVVGRSANFGAPERDYLYVKRNFRQRSLGILLYDGPFELHNVDFFNFDTAIVNHDGTDVTTVPFIASGGSRKFTNIVSGLRFSPEPHHRAFFKFPTGAPGDGKTGWMDSHLANNIRDKDGSLTGISGGLVLPANSFMTHSGCVDKSFSGKPSFAGMKVCPAATRTATLDIFTPEHPTWIPFIVRRSDGATSLAKEHWWILDDIANQTAVYHNRKFVMLTDKNYEYEVILKHSSAVKTLNLNLTAEYFNELSPVIKFMGYGSSCQLANAAKVTSLVALRSATADSYFDNGTDLYIRMKATGSNSNTKKGSPLVVSTESQGPTRTVSCATPVQSRVMGHIDAVSTNNSGTFVNGWACEFSKEASLDVNLYVGGAEGPGVLIGTGKANMNSEAGVSFACGDASVANHRFRVQIPANILSRYPGESLYIQAVSSSGQKRDLSRSGIVKLPGTKVAVSCSLDGQSVADGDTITAYQTSVVPYEGKCVSEGRKCVAGSLVGTYSSRTCAKNPLPTGNITGAIDGVVKIGADHFVNGWACDYGTGLQIPVHFYVGNMAGSGGTIAGNFRATLDSESAVAEGCGDAGGVGKGHRFRYKIPPAVLTSHKGKKIYLHGISNIPGKINKAISGSGSFVVP